MSKHCFCESSKERSKVKGAPEFSLYRILADESLLGSNRAKNKEIQIRVQKKIIQKRGMNLLEGICANLNIGY